LWIGPADRPLSLATTNQTDDQEFIVYLTHAIRSLAAQFPLLAEVLPHHKIRIKIRLYKYPKTSTARLLDLRDGGSSALSNFIGSYRRETKDFAGPGLTDPVIILYDNDEGASIGRNRSVGSRTSICGRFNLSSCEVYDLEGFRILGHQLGCIEKVANAGCVHRELAFDVKSKATSSS
jgi:hypothetical protein